VQESPIFVKTYDFLLWLLPQVQHFPRSQRFGLAERVQHAALDFQELLISAGMSSGLARREKLHQADVLLAQLRFWSRLSSDLHFISLKQYEHASRMLVEIGRLLGAWIKSEGAGQR
jgi:hypothetical protein